MIEAIEVQYACAAGCHSGRRKIQMRSRKSDEDVAIWMKELQQKLADDHASRSAFCTSRIMKEVLIPVDKDQPVGAPVRPKVN